MLFLNRCKSMIDPDSEGYLSNFSDFEELEPSGPRIGKPKTQNVIRKGYIDNAVSNTYPIGFTSTVSLQNWNVGITTRKTDDNVYVYFLKMKHQGDKREINCIISTKNIDNQQVNGTNMSLTQYKVFTIEEKQLKWNKLINFMKGSSSISKLFVALILPNLNNLKDTIFSAFKKLTKSTTKKIINWVQAP